MKMKKQEESSKEDEERKGERENAKDGHWRVFGDVLYALILKMIRWAVADVIGENGGTTLQMLK